MSTATASVYMSHKDRFWEGHRYLTEFVDARGHAAVPATEVVDGFRLGRWVSQRRTAYREGKLPAEYVRALEALPGWEWSARHRQGGRREREFARGLSVLRRYVAHHGHADVPVNATFDGFPLGEWASSVRHRRRIGKLTAQREAAVEDAAPGWLWERTFRRGTRPLRFEDAARLVADYVRATGECIARPGVRYRGFPVGYWMLGRQSDYARGILTSNQIAVIEATIPNWTW